MRNSILILILLLATLSLTSCSGGGGGGSKAGGGTTGTSAGGAAGGTSGGGQPPQEEEDPPRAARMVYDSELSARERVGLDNGTAELGRLNINGNVIPRFTQVFGGSRSSNVVNYVETRVNYAFSADTDLDSRIVLSPNFNFAEIIASNPSADIWFLSLAYEEEGQNLRMRVNNRLVDVNSSRVGFMQFGDPFAQFASVEQAIFLVHEGRHSDCTGGVTVADVNRSLSGQEMIDPRCGHAHRLCPPGHPDAGAYACDEHPWGAYAISAVYSFAISESCKNCSQAEKTLAETWGLISVRRLRYSYSDLLNGVFGAPNMSSSTTVR